LEFEVGIELGEGIAFFLGIVGEGGFCFVDLFPAAAFGIFADDEVADLSRLLHLFIITMLPKFKSEHHKRTSINTIILNLVSLFMRK
jgi:hypothetical protein